MVVLGEGVSGRCEKGEGSKQADLTALMFIYQVEQSRRMSFKAHGSCAGGVVCLEG